MDTTSLFNHFPDLTERQKEQYNQLKDLYLDWNAKINVISRKDMERFYEHHVLHSLAIAKYFELLPGMKVMDLGTGGGFPGIPLAIMFPQTEFYLIDGTGKKIKVVNAVKDAIGLENVVAEQRRAEEVKAKFDVVTGRAVMTLPEIANLAGNKLRIRGDAEDPGPQRAYGYGQRHHDQCRGPGLQFHERSAAEREAPMHGGRGGILPCDDVFGDVRGGRSAADHTGL